jgi:hypothetical protein
MLLQKGEGLLHRRGAKGRVDVLLHKRRGCCTKGGDAVYGREEFLHSLRGWDVLRRRGDVLNSRRSTPPPLCSSTSPPLYPLSLFL